MAKSVTSLAEKIKLSMDGRTNRFLARKCKIHESEISRILNGRLIPTDNQLKKINEALSINLKNE